MLKIAHHSIYCHPLPSGHRFPMLKYELIPMQLLHEGLVKEENFFEPAILEDEYITLTHDKNYWLKLKNIQLSYYEIRRIGFPLSAQLVERELRICQGTIDSALFAVHYGVSFNTAGGTHHSGSNWGEGFCLLNDQAVAANYLLNKNISKSVLIIDLDIHQGNGTAEIFRNNPNVYTFSMHGANNFPFRKEVSDLDIPLSDGISDAEYLELLKRNLNVAFEAAKPDMVFYQAGVDVLETDKLGKIKLSAQACKERDDRVFRKCITEGVPVQVSMGGGYSPDIKDIVDAHCNTYKAALDLYF